MTHTCCKVILILNTHFSLLNSQPGIGKILCISFTSDSDRCPRPQIRVQNRRPLLLDSTSVKHTVMLQGTTLPITCLLSLTLLPKSPNGPPLPMPNPHYKLPQISTTYTLVHSHSLSPRDPSFTKLIVALNNLPLATINYSPFLMVYIACLHPFQLPEVFVFVFWVAVAPTPSFSVEIVA